MVSLPSAIILVNNNVTLAYVNSLATHIGIQPSNMAPFTPSGTTIQGVDTQLQINETMWFDEFNARIASDPNYPRIIHLNRLRILVILENFQDTTNRHLFDVVMFIKQGVAAVLKCNFCEPGYSVDVQRLNIFNLLYGIRQASGQVWAPWHCFGKEDGYGQPCPYRCKPSEFQCCHGYPAWLPCCPPSCPPQFPPPICYPQTQTLENPRPPERHPWPLPEGMGNLERFGVEALETVFEGPQQGAFGGRVDGFGGAERHRDDCDCGCRDD